MNPLVSIVVPVYNSEKYLQRCVDSLTGQTLREIEVILVDDGSTDSSGKIADMCAECDSRVKVFHKKNGGPASARNVGIAEAAGKYIAFIDSDDWIDAAMMETLYRRAEEDGSDVVSCGYQYLLNGKVYRVAAPVQPAGRYNGQEVTERFLFPLIGLETLYSSEKGADDFNATSKLYRLSLIKEHGIEFPSERVILNNEDYMFNIRLLFYAKTLSVVQETPYFYEGHNASLSRRYKPDMWEEKKKLLEDIERLLKEKGLWERCEKRLNNNYINSAIEAVSNETAPTHNASLRQRLKKIRRILHDPKLRPLLKGCKTAGMSRKGHFVIFFMKHRMALALYLGYGSVKKYEYSSNKGR